MAACCCSIQGPTACGANVAATAPVAVTGRPSNCPPSFHGRTQFSRSDNSTAGAACSIRNSYARSRAQLGAGTGAVVGQREHLGRSLHLRETLLLSEGRNSFRLPGLKVEAAKRVQSGRSFVLSSTLVVAEGQEEKATALCQQILKWGEAKKKERGSGVYVFECNVDPFESSTYHFWERYDSFQIMNDIRSSPEHTKFMNDVRPLLVKPIGLAAYEYIDGQIGYMLNPIGPKGEGGLDDATGQGGTKQQSAVIGQGLGEMEEDVGSKAWGLDKILAKVRGESKEGGWSFKTLFGDGGGKTKK